VDIDWERILTNAGVSITGIDIGCSNGRPHEWSLLGSALRYVGVDPLIAEIERLRSRNEKNAKYYDALIEFPGAKGGADKVTSDLFIRTSAYSTSQNNFNSQQVIYNSGEKVRVSKNKISVTNLLHWNKIQNLDLLKIDIDGDDFLCLKAFDLEGQLNQLLCLDIESQFHGDNGNDGNTLWNIAKLANERSMPIYELEVNRYSRTILPSRFVYDFPAQTLHGQVLWGDAVFMRDPIESKLNLEETVKMISIFDIYGLYDCALEALESSFEIVQSRIPAEDIRKALIKKHLTRENLNIIDESTYTSRFRKKLKELIRKR